MPGDRILVLAPHTDDGELGAGATIAKFREQGREVCYVAFSACETVQVEPPFDRLRGECLDATSRLGIAPENVRILDFEVRHFLRDRQGILDAMVTVNKEFRPDLVLGPSPDDVHQDHSVVATEMWRAFKRTSMLGYELPWNTTKFETSCFVEVQRRHVDAKIDAIAAYASQAHRPYADPEVTASLLRVRGVAAGLEYAEAFTVSRWFV
jgi:LmbE family N-acetylglucosaminyl deacetylase